MLMYVEFVLNVLFAMDLNKLYLNLNLLIFKMLDCITALHGERLHNLKQQ